MLVLGFVHTVGLLVCFDKTEVQNTQMIKQVCTAHVHSPDQLRQRGCGCESEGFSLYWSVGRASWPIVLIWSTLVASEGHTMNGMGMRETLVSLLWQAVLTPSACVVQNNKRGSAYCLAISITHLLKSFVVAFVVQDYYKLFSIQDYYKSMFLGYLSLYLLQISLFVIKISINNNI